MATPPSMPVTITCPTCGTGFPVPTEVLGIDGHQVVVRMDRSELYGHLQACAAGKLEQPAAEQPRELEQPKLKAPAYVAKGKRTCTMCGTPGPDCLQQLTSSRSACCGACGEGNTHPAPKESLSCAEWAAEQVHR